MVQITIDADLVVEGLGRVRDSANSLRKKSSRKMYFTTLLVSLMFREDFFNTQMNG